MAEEQEGTDSGQELSNDEAVELERLLDDADGEGEESESKLKKILSNKKLLMIYGGGLLILILTIGAGVYFFLGEEAAEVVPVEDQAVEEEVVEEEEKSIIEKVNIYKMDPFFLPIIADGEETGRYIFVSPNFLLSNRVLNLEIDKVLPLLRKSIYKILKRKRLTDFTLKRSRTEERIKKEILSASNALLLSGKGTINDVFFTRFMIK
jgi:flagellar basal body-associated protein FliL